MPHGRGVKSMASAFRGWVRLFLACALGLAGLLAGFILLLDPFGVRVARGAQPRPLMDLNQRYMYPQLVRSGRFDGAVLGTSTMRLIDPARLSADLDTQVVNLAMNAATPWEQTEMARLFVRETPSPSLLVWGIDTTWCEEDATTQAKRLTPRPFPPWLYDEARWNDWGGQINLTTLEIALRLAANRLGLQPERIRGDGYEVFTPPEGTYDLARARFHLYRPHGGRAPDLSPLDPPQSVPAEMRAGWRFPALDWLDGALAALPPSARRIVVLPPVHLSALPRRGSVAAQRHEACKQAIGAVAKRRGAILLDYAHDSAVTRTDENYWDPLHFRLPIAGRVARDLVVAAKGGPDAADGVVTVSRPPR